MAGNKTDALDYQKQVSSQYTLYLKEPLNTVKIVTYICVCITGVFGNSLQIAVSIRDARTRFSVRLYTAIIAASDIVFLLISVTAYVYDLINTLPLPTFNAFSCFATGFTINVSKIFSIWVLCVLSVERYCVVRFPIWGRTHLARWKSFLVVGIAAVFAFASNAATFFIQYYKVRFCGSIKFHIFNLNISNLFLFNLIPLIVLTGTSIQMIVYFKTKLQRVGPNIGELPENDAVVRTAIFSFKVTIAMSIYFFLSTAPHGLFNGIHNYFISTYGFRYLDTPLKQIVNFEVRQALTVLLLTNFASRFYIALLTSRPLRETVKSMLKSERAA